jgi:hypothetical protein
MTNNIIYKGVVFMGNKNKRYTVRMTENEKKILELEAWKKNMKLSDYVRMKLFEQDIEKLKIYIKN